MPDFKMPVNVDLSGGGSSADTEADTPPSERKQPESVGEIEEKIRSECERIIDECKREREDANFFKFERELWVMVSHLGCLFLQLFLTYFNERLDYGRWTEGGLFYLKNPPVFRTIRTVFGKVGYWRTYVVRKGAGGGGLFPLDIVLGLTRDGFSPWVMSLAAKLATRVSFGTAVVLFRCFYGWSPSSESVQHLVLGMGREASAYMEWVDPPEGDGEVLIIEVDGKAVPTAREEELEKRRGKRKKQGSCCKRHRSRAKRKSRRRKRRRKGDKSKNGRSATIVVIYTLKIGSDGKLHGPFNKQVWASFRSRRAMLEWARRQATKRGFPPGTDKRVHIVVDGEKCLRDGLSELFPEATFALDIRHLEERIWKVGRAFHAEGSEELEEWVEEKRSLLYGGRVEELILQLEEMEEGLSGRDKEKRKVLGELLRYMRSRTDMMAYQKLIEEDLPIATGIVEGAARHVVGERLDCSGMRWIPGRAEALLHLRCIELNGNWEDFFQWGYERWLKRLKQNEKVMVRTNEPIDLSQELPIAD